MKVKCPTLFNVSMDDEVVPNEMSELLYDKCKAQVKLYQVYKNVGHSEAYTLGEYHKTVGNFVRKHVWATFKKFKNLTQEMHKKFNAICR